MPQTKERGTTTRITREGATAPVEGLEPTNFIPRGSEAAEDPGRGVYVRLSGRNQVKHKRNGEETFEHAAFFTRESDGAKIAHFDMYETWEGMEQIAADFRDAFLAMGYDEVSFNSPAGHDQRITYQRA